jgi:hypothetical protein
MDNINDIIVSEVNNGKCVDYGNANVMRVVRDNTLYIGDHEDDGGEISSHVCVIMACCLYKN